MPTATSTHMIEVSDTLTSWGAAGKVFPPGRHPTDNEELIDAAYRATESTKGRVRVRELRPGEAAKAELYEAEDRTGTLTKQDMEQGTDTKEFACPECAQTFRAANTLHRHIEQDHPATLAAVADKRKG